MVAPSPVVGSCLSPAIRSASRLSKLEIGNALVERKLGDMTRSASCRIGIHFSNLPCALERPLKRTTKHVGKWPVSSDWLGATLYTRGADEMVHHRDSRGIEVLLDGYVSDVVGISTSVSFPARAADLGNLWSSHGRRLLTALRGSYVCLIVDHARREAVLFNDRQASRSLYVRSLGESKLAIAPSIYALAALGPLSIDPEAVCEFALSRSFFDRRTLFTEISRFPMGNCLTVTPSATKLETYWDSLQVPIDASPDRHALLNSLHDQIATGVRRVLNATSNQVLFLSGGIDSRIVLGTLRELGADTVPVAIYGDSDDPGSDMAIARSISNALHITRHEFHMDVSAPDFVNFAAPSALAFDGCAESIDCAPLVDFYTQLAHGFETFVNGDVRIGGKPSVHGYEDALRSTHFHPLSAVPVFERAWLKPDALMQVESTRRLMLEAWVREIPHDGPDRFKNILYQLNRGGNYTNALAAGKRSFLEQARPLLDEDLTELLLRLPQSLATGKILFQEYLARFHPDLANFPYATRSSIPTAEKFRWLLHRSDEFAGFVHRNLVETMEQELEQILDKSEIARFISAINREGTIAAFYYRWFHRLPGGWRFMKQAPSPHLNPVAVLLRLLQLNLFLRRLAGDS